MLSTADFSDAVANIAINSIVHEHNVIHAPND